MDRSVGDALHDYEAELPDELRVISMAREGVVWTVVLEGRSSSRRIEGTGLTLDVALYRAKMEADA